MSDLTIDLFSSLDGFAVAEGWPGYWRLEGPELFEWLHEVLGRDHTVVMGAETYSDHVGDRRRGGGPQLRADGRAAEGGLLVHAAAAVLVGQDPGGRRRRRPGDPGDEAGGHHALRTMGSLSMGRSLPAAGLVDRFRVVVFPVITGVTVRNPIFQGLPDIDLEMVFSRTLDGRLQVLQYIPTLH